MIQLTLKRAPDAKADFSGWNFDDPTQVQKFEHFLDVVFSERGANGLLNCYAHGGEIILESEIEIEEFETYASAKVTLKDLVLAGIEDRDPEQLEEIINALRSLADTVERHNA